jgi:hypothetical protein
MLTDASTKIDWMVLLFILVTRQNLNDLTVTRGPRPHGPLSLSVTTPVTLHYLTLTLSVGAQHLHSKKYLLKFAIKELRARNERHPKKWRTITNDI